MTLIAGISLAFASLDTSNATAAQQLCRSDTSFTSLKCPDAAPTTSMALRGGIGPDRSSPAAASRIQDAFAVLRREMPAAMAPPTPPLTTGTALAVAPAITPRPLPTAAVEAKTVEAHSIDAKIGGDVAEAAIKTTSPSMQPKVKSRAEPADAVRTTAVSHPIRVGRSVTSAPAREGQSAALRRPVNWFAICSKFKSYDSRTGTYRAYSGKTESCRPQAAERHAATPATAPAQASTTAQAGADTQKSLGDAFLDFLAGHAPQAKHRQ